MGCRRGPSNHPKERQEEEIVNPQIKCVITPGAGTITLFVDGKEVVCDLLPYLVDAEVFNPEEARILRAYWIATKK
jgi:hypothetical protein